jgi:hypothetical protein
MTYWRRSFPCAFCKADADVSRLIKYSVRRYAHAACLLRAKGEAFIHTLPACPREQALREIAALAKVTP